MTGRYIIAEQKFHTEKIIFTEQARSAIVAQTRAMNLYIEKKLHQVVVIEVDGYALTQDKFNVIFKVERVCKCDNLQRVFSFEKGESVLVCPKCALVHDEPVAVNPSPILIEELI